MPSNRYLPGRGRQTDCVSRGSGFDHPAVIVRNWCDVDTPSTRCIGAEFKLFILKHLTNVRLRRRLMRNSIAASHGPQV